MSATTAAQRFAGQEDLVLMMLEHYLRILDRFSGWSREYRGHIAVVFPQAWSKLCFRTIGIRTIEAFGRSVSAMRPASGMADARLDSSYTSL